jgi:hypothetical protein
MDPSATLFHRTLRIRSTSTAQQRSLDYETRNRVLPLRDTRIKIRNLVILTTQNGPFLADFLTIQAAFKGPYNWILGCLVGSPYKLKRPGRAPSQ